MCNDLFVWLLEECGICQRLPTHNPLFSAGVRLAGWNWASLFLLLACYKRALNWYCIYSKVIFDWILCIIQLFSMYRGERRKQAAILAPEWL